MKILTPAWHTEMRGFVDACEHGDWVRFHEGRHVVVDLLKFSLYSAGVLTDVFVGGPESNLENFFARPQVVGPNSSPGHACEAFGSVPAVLKSCYCVFKLLALQQHFVIVEVQR